MLDRAIAVFSRHGYDATSITDLTGALKLTPGSLYKAFGDKEGLFDAAFDRYVHLRAERLREETATARSGRERVEAVLAVYADYSHGDVGRTGCLVVGSAVGLASSDPAMARRVADLFDGYEERLVRLIREGQEDGSIPGHLDARGSARLLLCIVQGMRVLGKTGRTRAEMVDVARSASRLLE